MGIKNHRIGSVFVVCMLLLSALVAAQTDPSAQPVRLLVIDETKTFLSTMRIGGLVGALKGAGLFQVDVEFADVESSWDNPLAGATPVAEQEPYDIVLVVPRGIDDGTADWVWILNGPEHLVAPQVMAGVDVLEQFVGLVFEGNVAPVGVNDDLMVTFLYGLYVVEGWIR